METQNPRIVWVGRDFRDHLVPLSAVGRAMDTPVSSSPSKRRKILLMQKILPLNVPILGD